MEELDFSNRKTMRSQLWALTKMILKFFWFYMVYKIRDLYEHFRDPLYGIQKRSREQQINTNSEEAHTKEASAKVPDTATKRPNYIRRVK